jgi:tripartite-type tricarboxylate transporter receptor subunit TctC
VQLLADKVKLALATPEAKSAADRMGIDIHYLGPNDLEELVKNDSAYWADVIKAKGIRAD